MHVLWHSMGAAAAARDSSHGRRSPRGPALRDGLVEEGVKDIGRAAGKDRGREPVSPTTSRPRGSLAVIVTQPYQVLVLRTPC